MATKTTLIATWLIFVGVCVHFGRSSYIRQETECFLGGASLHLSCAVGTVISIIWNATFFGRSGCNLDSQCCPDEHMDCTVSVAESAHFEGAHWETLNVCNNHTVCTVPVTHSSSCYPSDYETVTYMCLNTSGNISAVADWPTTEDVSTASSVVAQSTSETNIEPNHRTTTVMSPIGAKSPKTDMYVIEVWVSLSLLVLLVLTAVAVAVVCYKSGLAIGRGSQRQDPQSHHGDNPKEVRADCKTFRHEENCVDRKTRPTSSKMYQTPNDVYVEIVEPYTALERQYENTGHLTHTEVYSEIRPID